MATISEILTQATERLQKTSASARLDAELLLAQVLACSRLYLIRESQQELEPGKQNLFHDYLKRRERHEPIAYILGNKEFYGLDFFVDASVLVPRPETELLVEQVLAYSEKTDRPLRILELGTGSGCIPVALAYAFKKRQRRASFIAVDISEMALRLAEKNAQRHNVLDMIEFRVSNWFSAIASTDKFDVIVSNPPYIAPEDHAVSPELCHEPATALYAEEEGLADIEQILKQMLSRQTLPDLALIEIGTGQTDLLQGRIVAGHYGAGVTRCAALSDLAGLPRLIALEFVGG